MDPLQEDFTPLMFFKGCHAQTIIGSMSMFYKAPNSERVFVTLPDNDQFTLEVCTPKNWRSGDPTMVFIHGLCGSHRSNYLQRLAKKFYKKGMQSIRVNLRGCGSAKGYSRYVYHSGSSDDVHFALNEIKERYPDSPITLMGFSLGGNIVLKLVGELGEAAQDLLANVIAVCPPLDLRNTSQLISMPHNKMYEKYFIRLLREDVHYRHTHFDLPEIHLPTDMTVFEFDEYYIAPQIGYKSALEYYDACSAVKILDKIKVPTQILFAEDDPIIDSSVVNREALPNHVQVVVTSHGGHLGFLSNPFSKTGFRWLDYILLKWVDIFNPRQS
ncbi:MAG: 2-succinyl-6-hydroxy-2,4-cyclohexadiene-1-carboxylate synthase [Chlamydiia bacterium]|nr:2-succinyl-6-hydroxy-2,4-cyclohexadiene-1-carboxylate synthase [Chlamydiia bacterium]